ncbi:Fur family transcriptional regulator [uncultured Anaerococcus sp.]|uniref:Fur family transcriptional regulator n=1 Tax=uncultured Anaerococcus sp. TaxID=293428 RepID=UPI0028894E71|nr:Fur family transcriptional regulator [uncultured Anaerococcus sp.]
MHDLIESLRQENPDKRLSTLKKILQDKKIRVSHQRLLILDYLITHPIHPTAEKIFKDLKSKDPVISQATVYNSLNLFVNHKLVKELDFNMVSKRYEFKRPSHGHFICESCGKIKDLEILDMQKPDILKDYTIDTIEVIYRGLCPDCKE